MTAAKHRARLLATFLQSAFRALAIVGVSGAASAAMQVPTASTETLASEPAIRSALDFIRVNEPEVLNEQARLCEIAAPPFAERLRAEAYRAAFERLGLKNVRIDAVGNVIGERPGRAAGPRVVMSAHLDTVFPEGTNVKTTRSGSTIAGPGIADDCRGPGRPARRDSRPERGRLETAGSVTFVGTVGEEGLGDLRGVKHLFGDRAERAHRSFVSIDGAGLSITHIGVGSRRYRVAFKGPGGHSFGDFGIANPVHALGRAIGQDRRPRSPPLIRRRPSTWGASAAEHRSTRSRPRRGWRSTCARPTRPRWPTLDRRVMEASDQALAEENARWGNKGRLTIEKKLVGDRPAGIDGGGRAHRQDGSGVSRALGLQFPPRRGLDRRQYPDELRNSGNHHRWGRQRDEGSHSLLESFDSTESWKGTARALLLLSR